MNYADYRAAATHAGYHSVAEATPLEGYPNRRLHHDHCCCWNLTASLQAADGSTLECLGCGAMDLGRRDAKVEEMPQPVIQKELRMERQWEQLTVAECHHAQPLGP